MSGNSFGKLFVVTTFGESHGKGIGCVVDGCPPNVPLTAAMIQPFLDKRKPGQSKYTSQRRESDTVQILSGVFQDKTTGTPITLWIENQDARSRDYEAFKHLYRPGHADFSYDKKYGIRDYRGGGRASARETAARVAAGAIAQLFLKSRLNLSIQGYVQQIGSMSLHFENASFIPTNPFFCPNQTQVAEIEAYIDSLRAAGDSVGARIKIVATGVPTGLGDPIFDKLEATLAHAMLSIPAVRGFEIGAGFSAVSALGSAFRDEIQTLGFKSNHAGGILGGISSGQDIAVSLALKPTSSIIKPATTMSDSGVETTLSVKGRHDPCVGIRAVPIAEAMMALVLIDHYLRDCAQCHERHFVQPALQVSYE